MKNLSQSLTRHDLQCNVFAPNFFDIVLVALKVYVIAGCIVLLAADYQVGSLMDPDPYAASGNPYLSLYKSPMLDAEQPTFLRGEDPKATDKKTPRSEDELRFARGGNGIFGEPMVK